MPAYDAVVIGAGPNGLTSANLLASAGWSVLVLEAQPDPGGAVRSAELTRPGVGHDLFSAFYPLAVASPHLRGLDLERHGLRWRHAPLVLAHPLPDGRCASLSRDLDRTAASLEAFSEGDGDAWRELMARWEQLEDPLLEAIFAPFPPIRGALRLAATVGPAGLMRLLRFLLLPVRRMGLEVFAGDGGPLLLTGNALHADFSPESPGSGLFGLLLVGIGQRHGYPVPEGGAAALTAALVRRLEAEGGELQCGQRVDEVVVRDGRALGVRTADGTRVRARRAVLADTSAPALYLDLVGPEHLPAGVVRDIHRFEMDSATFKVDWLLDGPVPWTAEDARQAGTVHLGSMDEFTLSAAQTAMRLLPERPVLVIGQMDVADPTRTPAPHNTFWAYTKVPQEPRGDAAGKLTGWWDAAEGQAYADRVGDQIERHAPGFRDRIVERHVLTPVDLEARDANLLGGAVNGGTAQLHQQLVLRPHPGAGRPETPVERLYLASASAHPGGGVHGGPGANAAHAALLGPVRGLAARQAVRLLTGPG